MQSSGSSCIPLFFTCVPHAVHRTNARESKCLYSFILFVAKFSNSLAFDVFPPLSPMLSLALMQDTKNIFNPSFSSLLNFSTVFLCCFCLFSTSGYPSLCNARINQYLLSIIQILHHLWEKYTFSYFLFVSCAVHLNKARVNKYPNSTPFTGMLCNEPSISIFHLPTT